MKSNGEFELTGVIVLYICSDKKLRPVEFGAKHAKQVHGYLTHIQGGEIRLRDEESLLVYDTPATRAAMDEIENPKVTWRRLIAKRIREFFFPPHPQKSFERSFDDNSDHEVSSPKSRKIDIKEAV